MDNQNKTSEELQAFIEAQQKVIIQLNKKIQKLEAEKNQLENLAKNSPTQLIATENLLNDGATEEAICTVQIKRLEEISLGRELTLEETRKLETFSKILAVLRNNPKTIEAKGKEIKTSDLLQIVSNDGDRK